MWQICTLAVLESGAWANQRGSAPIMAQQQTEIIANATRSEAEVSEIQSLIARAGELSRGADWWNAAMLWALVFTAIAAIAVVLTTRMALRRLQTS